MAAVAGPAKRLRAPAGNDHWSGGKRVSNSDKTDGPLATLPAAVAKVRAARAATAKENRIVLRGGLTFYPSR